MSRRNHRRTTRAASNSAKSRYTRKPKPKLTQREKEVDEQFRDNQAKTARLNKQRRRFGYLDKRVNQRAKESGD